MKAIILLKVNPGQETKAYSRLRELAKQVRRKGVKHVSYMHLWGRFDGAAICECTNSKALNVVAAGLRKGGVFNTETLISIE